ncbi:HMA2 domain-containing protein [Methylomonas sp. MgM2]
MSRIVSSVPGRIRIRDKSLRDREQLIRVKTELSKIPVVTELHDNVRTGSILVRFKRRAVELSVIEQDIDAVVDQVVGKAPKPQRLLSKKNINRYNKIIMLASLGASLIALRMARRKRRVRWHKLTGYVFIANLGVHLYIYRKSLFRLFR